MCRISHGFFFWFPFLLSSIPLFHIQYFESMDALNRVNPVKSRHRASSVVSSLPRPLSPEHTNHRHSQPDLSSSAPSFSSQHQYNQATTASSSSLSSSAYVGSTFGSSSTTFASHNSTDGLTNGMTLDFEGGAHVIVRPNRIIRGKLVWVEFCWLAGWLTIVPGLLFNMVGTFRLDLTEKTQVTRILIKVSTKRHRCVIIPFSFSIHRIVSGRRICDCQGGRIVSRWEKRLDPPKHNHVFWSGIQTVWKWSSK